MIQVQARITSNRKEPLTIEIDILEREDATKWERKIAPVLQSVILNMFEDVGALLGAEIETTIIGGEEEEE